MFSFLSIEFAFMFVAFLAIYWLFRHAPKFQNLLLVALSYLIIYLMAGAVATAILFVYTVFVFFITKAMGQSPNKKKLLILGITITLIQLSVFKYYDFFRETIKASLDLMQLDSSGLMANIIFPLGISYYSFQAISYMVSRYYDEKAVPEFGFFELLQYLSFFATISAGPIARAKVASGLNDIEGNPCGMREQIVSRSPRRILFPTVALALILLALIKKWWLAGWLADNWVNPVFTNPMQYHSLEVLVAVYAYTLQLFLDFSGYSEMMVAFGLLLGFRLPMNFKAPLIAHNIRAFWDRWHISLSTWIRDYIYIPLGGSRHGFVRTQINLLIAMALSGIWHGSSLNFLLWGVLHGLAIIYLNCTDKLYQNLRGIDGKSARNALYRHSTLGKAIGIFVTVNFVAFCFVFFRATSWAEAMQIFTALANNHTNIGWSANPLYMLSIFIIAWLIYPAFTRNTPAMVQAAARLPKLVLIGCLFICLMIVIIFAPSGIPGFIYANF
ncbi:MBOAT family O-acyltransferase [Moraxella sp. ZJ142]|uniref:MBOAT family O-acyltransferase n=1 Tax=Moraxella marmotae TaxID=3344520 RepID=UPI0035D44009